jgi:ribonuclease HI
VALSLGRQEIRVKVFFDGGCRPNPSEMEIAVVAAGRTCILRDLGHGTSADAEWLALIHALKIAMSLDTTDFVLIGELPGSMIGR